MHMLVNSTHKAASHLTLLSPVAGWDKFSRKKKHAHPLCGEKFFYTGPLYVSRCSQGLVHIMITSRIYLLSNQTRIPLCPARFRRLACHLPNHSCLPQNRGAQITSRRASASAAVRPCRRNWTCTLCYSLSNKALFCSKISSGYHQ